ncbi:MAG TPA: Gfo/Idh/MocA family oxidoreductase [Mobilitalea sp.]|nr:Gfo/Idh/MocA family oxidoreductase [Mobilitalea sp.]
MRKMKVAMIGCGRISEMYLDVFKELQDTLEVVYAVDKDINKAEKFATEFSGCTALADYRECLDKGIDVFHIATPHNLHPIISIDAMKHGINVLTEKPMAIELQDADRMIQVSKQCGVKLGVIFQTRYVKGCQEIKKLIEDGRLGRIISARSYLSWSRSDGYYLESDWKGTWDKEGGGVLIDQAIHSIDRVQWLVGSEVEWIEGKISNRLHNIIKVEDVAEAFVKFKNGCVYQLYACNCYGYDAPIEIEIVGEKGKAGLKQDLAWVRIDGEEPYEIRDGYDGLSVGPDYWGCSHVTQIKDFYHSILQDEPVAIDGASGRKALVIIKGIYKSSKENKRVCVPFEE